MAFTLASGLVLSVLTLFVAAAWTRNAGEERARAALVLDQELQRAMRNPTRFLAPAAEGAWVLDDEVPPEFSGVTVEWTWTDAPSGYAGMALIRARATWIGKTLDPTRGVVTGRIQHRSEASVMVAR